MPDWLTHTLVGWITGKTIHQDISLIVIGALIPDISKIYLLANIILPMQTQDFFLPIHTPFGSVLIACAVAVFFPTIKYALIPLIIGVSTHFILDLFLLNVSGGMPLLFPFSWDQWQFDLIRSDDYTMTLVAIIAAALVYLLYFLYEKRKHKHTADKNS